MACKYMKRYPNSLYDKENRIEAANITMIIMRLEFWKSFFKNTDVYPFTIVLFHLLTIFPSQFVNVFLSK